MNSIESFGFYASQFVNQFVRTTNVSVKRVTIVALTAVAFIAAAWLIVLKIKARITYCQNIKLETAKSKMKNDENIKKLQKAHDDACENSKSNQIKLDELTSEVSKLEEKRKQVNENLESAKIAQEQASSTWIDMQKIVNGSEFQHQNQMAEEQLKAARADFDNKKTQSEASKAEAQQTFEDKIASADNACIPLRKIVKDLEEAYANVHGDYSPENQPVENPQRQQWRDIREAKKQLRDAEDQLSDVKLEGREEYDRKCAAADEQVKNAEKELNSKLAAFQVFEDQKKKCEELKENWSEKGKAFQSCKNEKEELQSKIDGMKGQQEEIQKQRQEIQKKVQEAKQALDQDLAKDQEPLTFMEFFRL